MKLDHNEKDHLTIENNNISLIQRDQIVLEKPTEIQTNNSTIYLLFPRHLKNCCKVKVHITFGSSLQK